MNRAINAFLLFFLAFAMSVGGVFGQKVNYSEITKPFKNALCTLVFLVPLWQKMHFTIHVK